MVIYFCNNSFRICISIVERIRSSPIVLYQLQELVFFMSSIIPLFEALFFIQQIPGVRKQVFENLYLCFPFWINPQMNFMLYLSDYCSVVNDRN